MLGMVRVDGSPDTVAASLHHDIMSPCTVACLLCVTSRSVLYCHRPAVSMSYTHLILAIRCVWPVLYAFNVLPAPRAW
jgi:hypothetical protein